MREYNGRRRSALDREVSGGGPVWNDVHCAFIGKNGSGYRENGAAECVAFVEPVKRYFCSNLFLVQVRFMYRETGLLNIPLAPAQEDSLLLTDVQRGDEHAMAVLFDRYSKVVYSVALRVLRDPSSAEDVLQEIFMQIWSNPNGFVAARGSLGGWLAVVARNRSIDTLRRRRPMDPVDNMVLASSFDLANEAERNSLMEKARGVIHALPPEQRKTLEMAFFDGLTHSEIAEMTGDPLGTVKTRIHSALLALRKAFKA